MNAKVFQSSHLHDGSFDPASGIMTITFNWGHVYTATVPEQVWNDLCRAVSPGRYFHEMIKPYYPLTRLKETPDADH